MNPNRAIPHRSLPSLALLVFGLVLQLSGLEFTLHEAAERDCSDGDTGVCILCIALTSAPASLETAAVLVAAPTPAHRLTVPGRRASTPHYGAEPIPGRSPPFAIPV